MTNRYKSDAGFSLAAVIFFATAVSIAMAAAFPVWQHQAKREAEAELIFRGEEYMRAIQKYHRRFNIYPPSIGALLETNGLRFLRRDYKDPLTGKAFRLIRISPDGTLIGSTMYTQRINNQPLMGGSPPGFGQPPPPAQPQSQVRSGAGGGMLPSSQTFLSGTENPSTFESAAIVGIASTSEEESIKVYNGREKYNEWEFIAIMPVKQ